MKSLENQKAEALQSLQEIASLTVWRSLSAKQPLAGTRDYFIALLTGDTLAATEAASAITARLMAINRPLTLAEFLFEELLYEDTPFSLSAGAVDSRVAEAAVRDLAILRGLIDRVDIPPRLVYPICEICTSQPALFSRFIRSEIEPLTSEMEIFYARQGSGIFARHRGFILQGDTLIGVRPDPVTFSDLIGYQREREVIIENTLALLEGRPSNNILLYGDRGTGKSTTVKALLNEYGDRGLRVLQLGSDQLFSLSDIIRTLENRRNTFILFIDDLSFIGETANYTALKSMLEGGLAARAENVVIYATSNRRHLIGEQFSERTKDVHAADTMQEKLSLADRFGITVTFSAPDQEQYIKIVFGLLEHRGLTFDREEVRTEALRWQMRQNGLSPRTARQFADWLEARFKDPHPPKNNL